MPSISIMRRKLQGYRASNDTFEGDLRFAQAQQSQWYKMQFRGAKLNGAMFGQSKFTLCEFDYCDLTLADLGGCVFEDCEFSHCEMGQAMLRDSVLTNVTFRDSYLAYSSFAGVTVRSAQFYGCNVHGADLDFVENNSCSFHNCNLWGAKTSLGCQFFNSRFDEPTLKRFVAMVARRFPPGEDRRRLIEIAGKQFPAVDRLMKDRRPEGEETGTREVEEPAVVERELDL